MKRCDIALSGLLSLLVLTTSHAQYLKKVTIGHTGSTCQAPVYVAYQKGFFKEEGLDVNLVQGDWNFLREGLAFGKIDAAQGLVMNFIKPIEQGLDVKFTAGIHRGCIYLLAPKDSSVAKPGDLKGKRVGVPLIGSSPWIFAVRVLAENGVDVKNGVEWKPFPPGELKLALEKGEVDAIAVLDPTARVIINGGTVKVLVDQSKDAPYKDEYCCVVAANSKFVKKDPDAAAKVTRAILKASKWVVENPQLAAEISVENKYVGASTEINAQVLAELDYIPSVEGGNKATFTAAEALKNAGILDASTDVKALAERTFARLPGVDDAWLETVKVAKEDTVTYGEIVTAAVRASLLPDAAKDGRSCCTGVVLDPDKVAASK